MRRAFIAFGLLFAAVPAHGAIALVQSTGSYNTTSTAFAASTFNAAPTVGNVQVAWASASNNLTLSMTGWNTGTCSAAGSGSSQRAGCMFWRIVVASHPAWGQTDSGSNSARILEMAEFSGIDTSNPLLTENSQITVSGSSHTTPSVSPTSSLNALVVTGYMVRAGGSWTAAEITTGQSSTEMQDRVVSTLNTAALCYNDVASTVGNYVGTGTSSSSNIGVGAIMVFRAAAGGGGAPDPDQFIPRPVPDPGIIGF